MDSNDEVASFLEWKSNNIRELLLLFLLTSFVLLFVERTYWKQSLPNCVFVTMYVSERKVQDLERAVNDEVNFYRSIVWIFVVHQRDFSYKFLQDPVQVFSGNGPSKIYK